MTKSVLQIHPEEGRVSRTFKRGKINHQVGTPQQDGYLQLRIDGKMILVHRLIYEHVHGPIPENFVVDHINRDKLDNRISNLRLVTPSNNSHNSVVRKSSKTGVKGVGFDKFVKKFRGVITVDKVRYKTNYCSTLEKAAAALEVLKTRLINEGKKIV